MSAPVAQTTAKKRPQLAVGQLIGGRFQFERRLTEDALGEVVAAKDTSSGKGVALRLLARRLTESAGAPQLLVQEVKLASTLQERGIIRTFGMGQDPSADWFIACERIDGHALSDIIGKRREEKKGGISLRGAYNVIAHVCTSLTSTQGTMPHGAVRPSVIWVNNDGQVKIGDFGVGRALIKKHGAAALGATEQAYLAPEVKAGHEPTPRSDLFGVGALLYTMLTGRSPSEDFVAPSKVNSDATKDVDAILLRCLAADPAKRFASPEEVQRTLLPLVAQAPEADADDFDMPMEIDEGLRASGLPKPRSVPPSIPPAGDPQGDATTTKRQAVPKPPAVPNVPGASSAKPANVPGRPSALSADQIVQNAIADIEKNDAPRWMFTKNGMDHGPFSGRELATAIVNGEALPTHLLFNLDTRERKELSEYPQFAPFLEQQKIRELKKVEQRALERSANVEKAGMAVKFLVAGGIIAVIAIVAVIYAATRPKEDNTRVASANLADLYERGEIQITGSAGILPVPRGGGSRGGGGGGHRSAGRSGGSMTYEEAMSQGVNIGDATRDGGEQQLSRDTVAGVMNRNLNSLFGCVGQELRRGGHVGNVQIDLAIAGSGQVLGATVRTGSSAFQSCIAQRARSIRFPAFSAPRMGARYSFAVD